MTLKFEGRTYGEVGGASGSLDLNLQLAILGGSVNHEIGGFTCHGLNKTRTVGAALGSLPVKLIGSVLAFKVGVSEIRNVGNHRLLIDTGVGESLRREQLGNAQDVIRAIDTLTAVIYSVVAIQ